MIIHQIIVKNLQRFLIKNKNIVRLISNPKNLGVGKSRNIGLRNSKGRYIIF